ncbi:transposase family protein [Prosthecobacter sp. SYSU 5D2]|uniref:transposase family protein n=1 Tax=Prosthecobacter sp. SYSU 5D2 TaxID=3134134 RepID=UPI0031FEDD4C
MAVDVENKEVIVRVRCDRTAWFNEQHQLHVHGWEKRCWRHLDLWQYRTIIEAEVPRLRDPATGATETAQCPGPRG